MSVHPLPRDEKPPTAVSGGAMDRAIPRRRLDRRWLAAGVATLALGAGGVAFWHFAPRAGDQTVAAERLSIAAVRQGVFEDFLPLRARATPLVTVYLDAVEGGRVEKVLVEDGTAVTRGQLLAVLSNPDLRLNLLARQADVSREVNSMRAQELALAQTRLDHERAVLDADAAARRARRQLESQRPLADSGFVSPRALRDAEDDDAAARERLAVLERARAADDRLRSDQLAQLRRSAESLSAGLDIARASLESMNLRAPVDGRLTAFAITVGQSLQRGERLGQVDSPGRDKLVADVDEFYLGRVQAGLPATIEHDGKTVRLKVARVQPQVRNGQFQIDLAFVDAQPPIQRGQTLQARLAFGDPTPARLVPAGGWLNDTGGRWIFVVDADGRGAARRDIRTGRRNAESVEVLEGLAPGERVVTSPYTGLADTTRLRIDAAPRKEP